MPDKILVLGIDTHIGLAIIRSLGKKGAEVYGVAHSPDGIGLYSRYAAKKYVISLQREGEDAYIDKIERIITSENIKYVMAISENILVLLNKYRYRLERMALLIIPDVRKLEVVLDKRRTCEIAIQLGMPVPRIYEYGRVDGLNAAGYDYPLVLKPNRQSAWSGYKYKIVSSKDELGSELEKAGSADILIERFQEGYGVGMCILMKNGEALAAFQHRRVHEIDGVSVLAESTAINPLLYDHSVKLLKKIGWEGVAMVEWRYKDDNNFSFIEINGRFWGSLPLSIACGVDFPHLLYLNFGKNVYTKAGLYRTGVRFCIFTGEMRYALINRNAWILANIFNPRIVWNCFAFDDPVPGFMDIVLTSKNRFILRPTA